MSHLTKQSELKNCPFCGSAPRVTTTGVWWVVCDECACEGPVADSDAEAIAIWNTRPASAGVREALAIRAPQKAEELYQVGLLNAPDGLCDDVVRLRREALSDHGVQKGAGVEPSSGAVTSSPGHTPGPWDFEADEASSGKMFTVYDRHGIRLTDPYIGEREARLIAATPDLLKACQEVVTASNSGADTVNFLVALNRVAKICAAAIDRAALQAQGDER